MTLSDHDLRQLDESYIGSLAYDQLRVLSLKLLADIKVARDRLNRTPQNSSVPPGSLSLPPVLGRFDDWWLIERFVGDFFVRAFRSTDREGWCFPPPNSLMRLSRCMNILN